MARLVPGAVNFQKFRQPEGYLAVGKHDSPLRRHVVLERNEGIGLLVDFLVDKITKRPGKSIESIPVSVMNTLQGYLWPGNVRELENVLERAVINSSGSTVVRCVLAC